MFMVSSFKWISISTKWISISTGTWFVQRKLLIDEHGYKHCEAFSYPYAKDKKIYYGDGDTDFKRYAVII